VVLAPVDYGEAPAAEGSRAHLAGSTGKLLVMRTRIARGLSSLHPSDGMAAWQEFICEVRDGWDGWGLAIETCGGRVRGVKRFACRDRGSRRKTMR
jgi:hypothetical protein